MPSDYYKTIAEITNGNYKEKGSSFLSMIVRLKSEAEVKSHIQNIRKEHPKARHICYAYRFGLQKEYSKYNDDGEPGGTAGKPILGQLIKFDLENTLIAVTRYFGGTLLGTSGLAIAYKTAAENAILKSQLIEVRRNSFFQVTYPYTSEKFIENYIRNNDGAIIKKEFSEWISCHIAFPLSQKNEIPILLEKEIRELQLKDEITITHISNDAC
ncbi:MAG: YigZ family protein [Saprospiraceae bacterium]